MALVFFIIIGLLFFSWLFSEEPKKEYKPSISPPIPKKEIKKEERYSKKEDTPIVVDYFFNDWKYYFDFEYPPTKRDVEKLKTYYNALYDKNIKMVKYLEFSMYVDEYDSYNWPIDLSYWENTGINYIDRRVEREKKIRRNNKFFMRRNDDTNKALYYGFYYPSKNNDNNNKQFSINIIKLKNKDENAINYFFNLLDDYLGDNFVIATVPSHDANNLDTGINRLVKKLILSGENRIDGTDILKRQYTIEKLSAGGNRNYMIHMRSIIVDNERLVEGRKILLLDDVTTSHNSLKACRMLLLEAGALEVQAFALGKTDSTF